MDHSWTYLKLKLASANFILSNIKCKGHYYHDYGQWTKRTDAGPPNEKFEIKCFNSGTWHLDSIMTIFEYWLHIWVSILNIYSMPLQCNYEIILGEWKEVGIVFINRSHNSTEPNFIISWNHVQVYCYILLLGPELNYLFKQSKSN